MLSFIKTNRIYKYVQCSAAGLSECFYTEVLVERVCVNLNFLENFRGNFEKV